MVILYLFVFTSIQIINLYSFLITMIQIIDFIYIYIYIRYYHD